MISRPSLHSAKYGKMVLPCKRRFQPRDRWFFPIRFAANWAFAPVTRLMPRFNEEALFSLRAELALAKRESLLIRLLDYRFLPLVPVQRH